MRSRTQALLALVVVIAVGCGDYEPLEGSRTTRNEDRGTALVLRYCAYRATSVPNLEGCLRRTTPSDVRSDNANAARYATGETVKCRRDAGPYCGKVGPYGDR